MTSSVKQEIENLNQLLTEIEDNLEKYQVIMDFGDSLPELTKEFLIDENRVQGCQSELWIKDFGTDVFELRAQSEALIVRGLVAMILKIYNGKSKDEVANTEPNVLAQLGISGILTPGRQNGVGNLIKKIYGYAGK